MKEGKEGKKEGGRKDSRQESSCLALLRRMETVVKSEDLESDRQNSNLISKTYLLCNLVKIIYLPVPQRPHV